MKSPLIITGSDIISKAKRDANSTKFIMRRKKMLGIINANFADHETACSERILELLRIHFKDPQANLFEVNQNINKRNLASRNGFKSH